MHLPRPSPARCARTTAHSSYYALARRLQPSCPPASEAPASRASRDSPHASPRRCRLERQSRIDHQGCARLDLHVARSRFRSVQWGKLLRGPAARGVSLVPQLYCETHLSSRLRRPPPPRRLLRFHRPARAQWSCACKRVPKWSFGTRTTSKTGVAPAKSSPAFQPPPAFPAKPQSVPARF
jgi:hypothetical protein